MQHAAVLAPAIVRNLPLRFFLSPSDKFPLKMADQTSIWHSRNVVYKIWFTYHPMLQWTKASWNHYISQHSFSKGSLNFKQTIPKQWLFKNINKYIFADHAPFNCMTYHVLIHAEHVSAFTRSYQRSTVICIAVEENIQLQWPCSILTPASYLLKQWDVPICQRWHVRRRFP